MEEKEIMTAKQVAEYLQMNEHTIYRLARSGQIPSIKIAGQSVLTPKLGERPVEIRYIEPEFKILMEV